MHVGIDKHDVVHVTAKSTTAESDIVGNTV
jgi:hypothetical protein